MQTADCHSSCASAAQPHGTLEGFRVRRTLGDHANAKNSFSLKLNPPAITANVVGMRTARPAGVRAAGVHLQDRAQTRTRLWSSPSLAF